MVSINNLDVRFDVEGDGDEATFARLFEKYVRQWHTKQEEASEREHRDREERAVGDRPEV
ncbi:MAG: hypothetical protein QOJ88_1014 [Pyrinomonadaceae bacterium]|jgi:hypothetical protein|nr:hypothetical protein [Pyrinomonadaceae bacterium]MDQ1728141.1 hypothetical protein [Pyrinomonadaceae bacterium]